MADVDFDVGIIGGGPAGASIGAYLAQAGVKCAVFERDLFPREHVGESLVPSSTRVFRDLGLIEMMDEQKFPRKYGAVWTSAKSTKRVYDHDWAGLAPDNYADIRFEERDQPGVDRHYTWHVDRGKFDALLLKHAHKLGATVFQGIRIRQVDFSDPQHVSLRYELGKQEMATRVKMVVDASGRQTMLGVQEKLKVRDPVFDQYAIHSWFDDFNRVITSPNPNKADYIYIHFLPISNSWVWQIPVTDKYTSVGVVTQKKNFAKTAASREQFFWDAVASRPELYEGLKKARQMRPFKEEGDYSYSMKQICGDRFVMIGDAGRFVDPIFSTGVSIAMNSARFVKDDIINACKTGDFSRKAFAKFEATIRRGVKNWYNFIGLYYRLNVLFTAFILDKRYRLDVLKLLQGDVYDTDEPEVLTKMRETVQEVEQNEKHPWHGLLGELAGYQAAATF
jgi:FADH2 O2-dependent halogenase